MRPTTAEGAGAISAAAERLAAMHQHQHQHDGGGAPRSLYQVEESSAAPTASESGSLASRGRKSQSNDQRHSYNNPGCHICLADNCTNMLTLCLKPLEHTGYSLV